jgi:uncharacterized membrane protein
MIFMLLIFTNDLLDYDDQKLEEFSIIPEPTQANEVDSGTIIGSIIGATAGLLIGIASLIIYLIKRFLHNLQAKLEDKNIAEVEIEQSEITA